MPYEYTSIYLDNPIAEGRALDILAPADLSRDIALFFVHGGGWRGGSRLNYHKLMRAFNAEGYLCGACDYRLTGIDIRDQIADVRHAYDLFVSRLREAGRPLRIATFGSSAGAHLNALLSLAGPGDCGEPTTVGDYSPANDWVPPVACMVQATPTTFEPWDEIFPQIWAGMQGIVGVPYKEAPQRYRAVSPINHVDEDSCPVFLLEAANEHMFPPAQVEPFVARLRTCGCRVETRTYANAEHGFIYDVTRPCQQRAFTDMLAFLDSLGDN